MVHPVRGSSPLTRGALASRGLTNCPDGLIPAHAGSTWEGTSGADINTAHPRSRGEHLTCATVGVALKGSSPLTRGAHYLRHLAAGDLRLIPAHAGSTGR